MKQLPEELRRANGLPTITDEPDDLFIACASFEPRTLFSVENLSTCYVARRCLIYVNREFLEGRAGVLTKPNLYRMIEYASKRCEKVDVTEGSWLSDVDQITAIRRSLSVDSNESVSPKTVTLDCTTFNREALLALLMLIRSQWPHCRVRAVYASPRTHGRWLSRGFRSIRNVMGLCGVQLASRPTILVVLSGFEPHRVERIIEEHEPSRVLMGVGDPPTSPEFLDRNRLEQELVLARQYVERFTFPAGDIAHCRDVLKALVEPHIDSANIVMAPMSTKFSTIGALLTAESLPQIQVTYCLPGEYNLYEYSHDVKAFYVQELPNVETMIRAPEHVEVPR